MGKKKKPMILVKSLTKNYNSSKKPVIDNLNLNVKKGEMLVLLGKSGCGKTTLLNIIAGLDRPTSGEVYIEGIRVDEMTEDQLARFRLLNIGFVFQDYNLINDLTVLDNVALPLKFAKKKNLARAKKLLNIFDIAKIANEKAKTISGGEAQRTAIARALANNPNVLLADEPTGSLDQVNSEIVMKAFKKAQKELGTTVVIVTHNKWIADWGDRILVIEAGRIGKEITSGSAT